MSPKEPRAASESPSFGQHMKWSVALVVACVVIAKLAIPILEWLGFS